MPTKPFLTPILTLAVVLISGLLHTAPAQAETPWGFSTGITASIIDETVHATQAGARSTIEVDSLVSPFIRLEYSVTPTWRMDLTGAMDIYGGTFTVSDATTTGRESITGLRIALGPTWLGPKVKGSLGTYRPLAHAGIAYASLFNNLNYPITSYDDAWGLELSCGMRFNVWEMRLKGSWLKHDARSTRAGFTPSSSDEDLELFQVGIEVAIHAETT
ncbi:MAG: hypothetical protein MI742_04270 [Desulfobacterales bacterium]|nr:hypothetical protein [Desulfobacterales bacterium]